MMNNFLNGMFGKVGNGMCRLSMSGGIAVKTSIAECDIEPCHGRAVRASHSADVD